jgi:hypothetical protein
VTSPSGQGDEDRPGSRRLQRRSPPRAGAGASRSRRRSTASRGPSPSSLLRYLSKARSAPWREQSRVVFLTVVSAGLRRGEILGLRWRHASITNWAAAGMEPRSMMARAGHSDFKTTKGYIDLAGEVFREDAKLADERLFGQKWGQK